MTKFLDGPAKGQVLMLKRAPMFLRVTRAGDKWDALDLLGESPQPEETLFAYELAVSRGVAHINMGGCGSGYYTMADYRQVLPQPDQLVMRNLPAWEDWCRYAAGIK